MIRPQRNRRQRVLARGRWKQLSAKAQSWLLPTLIAIWNDSGDVGKATKELTTILEQSASEQGFDPATVILMIKLGVLIFEVLKALGYFKVTTETLAAIFDTDVETLTANTGH